MSNQLVKFAAVLGCLLLALPAVSGTFIFRTCKQYEATTLSVLKKVIWPTSRNITISGKAPPEFAMNANGRVVPAGTFATNLGALEYFYRLGGPLELNDTTTSRVVGINIRWMVCDNQKKQVAFECIFRFSSPAAQVITSNISAMGVFTFDNAGKVCAYDWDLRRLGLTVEASNQLIIDQVFNGSVDAFNAAQITQICDVAMTLCTGPNKQYNSKAECVKFLQSLPIGDWDRADQANVVCRTLHALLVPVRPAVHCPHIGPTGGGKCVENPINLLFTEDFSKCSAT